MRTQALGTELLTGLGLDPTAYRLMVLKSAQHFASAYGPYASLILRAEAGGCCPTDPRRYRYRYARVQLPLWPLDAAVTGRLLA